jgi:hypothetical protein
VTLEGEEVPSVGCGVGILVRWGVCEEEYWEPREQESSIVLLQATGGDGDAAKKI